MNVKQLLTDLKIDFRTEGKNISKGKVVGIICPFCNETSYHCGIFLSTGTNFFCFACREKGSLYRILQELRDTTWKEYLVYLKQYGDDDDNWREDQEPHSKRSVVEEGLSAGAVSLERLFASSLTKHKQDVLDFLAKRRFTVTTATTYQTHYVASSRKLVFPIIEKGKIR